MIRLFLPLIAFAFVLAATPGPTAAQPGKAAPQPAANPYVIALNVSLTPAPVPALKYELLAPPADRTRGNAAVDYLRAVTLLPEWPRDPKAGQKQNDAIDRWSAASLDDFPAAEVEEFLKAYKFSFASLDQAARRERTDWQLAESLNEELFTGLMNDGQKYRELVRFNSLRLRLHLARNDFDAALRDLQAGFRLGKDVAESPTMIRMLIGFAIAAVATGDAEKWVGRPDAPNLYWALQSLPKPFIDPRPGLDGEAAFNRSALPQLGTDPDLLSLWDDQVTAFGLSYPRATAEFAKLTERATLLKLNGGPVAVSAALVVPATAKTHYAYARVGRRLAGLQAVEAVRLHAAANGGKFPAKLADVSLVPVPDDPFTGKPFEYATTAAGFTLDAPPTAGEAAHAGNSFRYDVTVRKK